MNLQDPPREKLSDFTMSYIPHNSRNVHFSQIGYGGNADLLLPCDRCGTSHRAFRFRFCKALTRKCYKCRRYGHYANYCTFSVDPTAARKQPSADEDSDCESESSFCSVDTSPCANEAVVLELKVEHSRPKSDSLMNAEKTFLKNQCQVMQDQNKELSEQVSQLESSLCNTEQKLNQTESQVRSVFQYTAKLMEACVEFDHLMYHVRQEFVGLDELHASLVGKDDLELCLECGLIHDDPSLEGGVPCPAEAFRCCRCGSRDHWTTGCDQSLPKTEPDQETWRILSDLEKTTGLKLCKSIDCLQCDIDLDNHIDTSGVLPLWEPQSLNCIVESVVNLVPT